jgi:alkaline phosphatase
MLSRHLLTCLFVAFSLTVLADSSLVPESQHSNHWYSDAEASMANKSLPESEKKAKNVILFIGDGMGIGTVTAARILDGQNKGQAGEENQLSFESFPFTGLSKTYNVDAQTPDSAGTMTAIITGVKTDAGIIGIDEDVERGKCKTVAGNELVSALELAELDGKSTGIVTTTRVTHATPAATYAKSPERNWEDVSDMPEDAVKAGCEDIASQLVHFEANLKQRYPDADNINGIDVVMGGGRRHFLPHDKQFNSLDAASEIEGDRTDKRDLIAEWEGLYPAGQYVYDKKGLEAVDTDITPKLLGLFNESHMHYESDRENDKAGEPSLSEMTAKAIDMLDNNDKGFFLMVEGGRIDHAHHAGNAYNALNETIELSHAVQTALDKTNAEDTLIVVTADHSHVFTMAGYPKRGNPILGKVVNIGQDKTARAMDGKPYTTLGYANGLGYRDLKDETDADKSYEAAPEPGRQDLTDIDTTQPGYHQETLVPLEAETHSGEDVSIYAIGPGAAGVSGVNEQNVIFHVINRAAELDKSARDAN